MSFNSISNQCEKNILVPLDGSSTAEAALPYAVNLARSLHTQLVLVYAVRPLIITESSIYIYNLIDETLKCECDKGQSYLDWIVKQFRQEDLVIQSRVKIGDRIQVVLDQAKDSRAVMVVMTADQPSWLQRCLMGSEADQLVHEGTCPVVLINGDSSKTSKAILVNQSGANFRRAMPNVELKTTSTYS